MSQKDHAHSIEKIREMLSAAGLRTTTARTAVVRWLQKSKTPATHAEIAANLVPLGVDKATVFRNLNDLVDAGLASRTELGDRPFWRFELHDPDHADRGQHPHFVCLDCVSVTCLRDLDLPRAKRRYHKSLL